MCLLEDLYSNYKKNSQELNDEKITQLKMHRHFTKKDVWMAESTREQMCSIISR